MPKKPKAAAAVALQITEPCDRDQEGYGALPFVQCDRESMTITRAEISAAKATLLEAGFESLDVDMHEWASDTDHPSREIVLECWSVDGDLSAWKPQDDHNMAGAGWTLVAMLSTEGADEVASAVAILARPAGMAYQVAYDIEQADPQPAPAMSKNEAHLGRKPGLFQLTEWTEAMLATVTNRAERHGDEKAPGVSLGFQITGPNTILDAFGANLRHTLYARAAGDDQEALDGMDSTPLLRSKVIGRIPLKMPKLEGWRVLIDHGIDEDDPIDLHDCSLKKFFHEPFDGGSGQTDFMASTNDVDKVYLGLIGMKIGQLVRIKVLAPAPKPEAIDGSTEAFERDHPTDERDAGDLFAEEHGGSDDGAEEQRQQDEAVSET